MNRALFLSLILVLLAGCRSAKPPDYQGLSHFKIHSIGAGESVLRFHLDYFNPNGFGVTLKDGEFDVYVEREFLGHARLEQKIRVPARSAFSVPIRLTAASGPLLKHSLAILMNSPLLIRVEGTTRLGKAGFYKNYPVFFEGKQVVTEDK